MDGRGISTDIKLIYTSNYSTYFAAEALAVEMEAKLIGDMLGSLILNRAENNTKPIREKQSSLEVGA